MKKWLFLLFLLPAAAFGADSSVVGDIHITTTRVDPAVVARKFPLKTGDTFTPQAYEDAQNKLHDMRLFKKLDFDTHTENGRTDISISAEDGYYFFPLAFFSSGDKDVFFMSLFEGNFFKKGETAFALGGVSSDGYTFSGGVSIEDNFFNVSFTKLDTEQRFYGDHWSSMYGVMNVADDEEEYGDPLYKWDMRDYDFKLTYARTFGDFSAFISPEFKHTSYSAEVDAGSHNQLSAGLSYRKRVRTSSGMGAWFGFGLSDKQQMLRNIPAPRYAYGADASFTKGGDWSGADYDITKLSLNFLWQMELKQHHILSLQVKGQNAYGSPFSDQILSTDLLGGQGKYRRLIRGRRGAGVTASFLFYILRGNTGLLALRPFYELAYVYTGGAYRDHSGAGATLSYKFWRVPFPLGINYTRNLSDHSDIVSFVLGGQF